MDALSVVALLLKVFSVMNFVGALLFVIAAGMFAMQSPVLRQPDENPVLVLMRGIISAAVGVFLWYLAGAITPA